LPWPEPKPRPTRFRAFADFGLFVHARESLWAAIRCGSVGQRGNGGHAHNDQLAIELCLAGVAFIDSGTVTDEVGFDQYRVSVGIGLRLYIPQFGPAPLAFDFAVPLMKQDTDETQVFSFSAEIPF
jgi:hypothetical protein